MLDRAETALALDLPQQDFQAEVVVTEEGEDDSIV